MPICPNAAIRNANKASAGMVCNTLTTARISGRARVDRAAHTPKGTPTPTLIANAPNTNKPCSHVSRQKSSANRRVSQPGRDCDTAVFDPAKKSAATRVNG